MSSTQYQDLDGKAAWVQIVAKEQPKHYDAQFKACLQPPLRSYTQELRSHMAAHQSLPTSWIGETSCASGVDNLESISVILTTDMEESHSYL